MKKKSKKFAIALDYNKSNGTITITKANKQRRSKMLDYAKYENKKEFGKQIIDGRGGVSEIWKDIPGYEWGYQVSNLGRVKGKERKVQSNRGFRTAPEKILGMRDSTGKKHGHKLVTLCDDGIKTNHRVHDLVTSVFIGQRPLEMKCIHLNGDRSDNRLENLKYHPIDTLPISINEIWKDIPGYEGLYQASNLGRVKRLGYYPSNGIYVDEKIRKQTTNNRGYRTLSIYKNNIHKHCQVHRLILLAFIGQPQRGMVCFHNNGIRDDNRLENLRYDANKPDFIPCYNGEDHPGAKLTASYVKKIRYLLSIGISQREIADKYRLTQPAISAIKRRVTWSHI
jgi:hypothetical protein